MGRTPKERFDSAIAALNNSDVVKGDKEAIREFVSAKNPNDLRRTDPTGDTKEYSTLYQYTHNLMKASQRMETPLCEATVHDLNDYLQSCMDGSHPDVKDGGYSQNTIMTYSGSLRKFYGLHSGLGIDPDDIAMPTGERPSVDPGDMFTPDEIQAMRESCTNVRDKCILELFLNTGQRLMAIQTLRIKDIDIEGGRYRLNPDVDGLKRAKGRRPLLGAKNAVREWIEMHPTGEPEHYLVTRLPEANYGLTPDEIIGGQAIRDVLQRIGDRAGVKKPLHPHNFRHNFVTICKRDYDMDNDTIKHLIGHSPDSQVMETTYAHLSDEDFNTKAEVSAGYREKDEQSSLSPPVCPTCSEPLPEGAKACSRCGQVFTPDAQSAKEQIQTEMQQGLVESQGGTHESELLMQLAQNFDISEMLEDEHKRGMLKQFIRMVSSQSNKESSERVKEEELEVLQELL